MSPTPVAAAYKEGRVPVGDGTETGCVCATVAIARAEIEFSFAAPRAPEFFATVRIPTPDVEALRGGGEVVCPAASSVQATTAAVRASDGGYLAVRLDSASHPSFWVEAGYQDFFSLVDAGRAAE